MSISEYCLIIGTQKGGTSSLFAYMAQHPQVIPSQVKETNFFSEDPQWKKGLDYYKSLWETSFQPADIAGDVVALEASPNYTNSLQEAATVVQRVKAAETKMAAANFKFIYVLRDPLQKIVSMRKQGVYQGWYEPLLAQETPATVPPETLEPARYAEIIDIFVEGFSREKILLLSIDELRPEGDSVATMVRICEFLGIDPTFEFSLEKIHNSQNSYRQDTFWHLLRSSKSLAPLKGLFPDALKNKARALLSKPVAIPVLGATAVKTSSRDAPPSVVPPLTDAQKGFILEALKGDRQRLTHEYNVDVSAWR